jgi:hypothetical protein
MIQNSIKPVPLIEGTQPQNRFQLRGKTWTAPAPNNLKYNLINVRRNIR